ncbi:MAG: ATP-binding protein [Emcibacteraceae bacterium]|nr:ATP-binding protein [Emcibacteraceae bacterium]
MLETMARTKNVRLFYKEISRDAVFDIFGDETAIKRILINLLSNAIKFTESVGIVTCSISVNDNGDAELSVKDTGIGIPENKIEHVLSPFGQDTDAQVMVKSEAGTGLGLSIVKQLADMHGGEFILESKVGVGTSATIVIPKNRIIEVKRIKPEQSTKILRTA